MTAIQAVSAGLVGEKLSRTITGTSEVSAGRSAVATVAGAALGAGSVGAVSVGAAAVGATAFAAAAAPVVVPAAAVAAGVALIRSWFD